MDKSQTYAKTFLGSIAKAHDEESFREFSRNFLAVLKRKRELYLLPKILKCIDGLLTKDAMTLVTSRFTLDATAREKLAHFLKKTFGDFHENQLAFETNESILGGISVRHKDFLYDATLDSALGKLKQVWK